MADWVQVQGKIRPGYGVASGRSPDPRFPQGTIAMQTPFFQALGLDLSPYFSGTLNLAIAPYRYCIKQPKCTFRQVKWSPEPAEDFSFFDCCLVQSPEQHWSGLIYYPHPETKPEHFQAPDLLEILAPWIPNLNYGDLVTLACDRQQMEFFLPAGDRQFH